jgi:HEAT repeat protein
MADRPLPFPDAQEVAAKNRRLNPSAKQPHKERQPTRPKETDHRQDDLFDFSRQQEAAAKSDGPVTSRREKPRLDPDGMTIADLLDILARHLEGDSIGGEYCCRVVAELARRKETQSVPLLERLCRQFAGHDKSGPTAEMLAALDGLTTIGEPSAAPAVTDLVTRETIGLASMAAGLQYLARVGHRAAAPLARRHLQNDDPAVRRAACELTAALRLGSETDVLNELTSDINSGVARTAAVALGRMGYRPIKNRLEELLSEAVTVDVPVLADALIAVADDDTAVLLGRTAERADEAGRCAIVQALGQMEARNAAMSLARMSHDSRPTVRLAVVDALGIHRGLHAAEALQLLARDPDSEVRKAAETVLGKIEDEEW